MGGFHGGTVYIIGQILGFVAIGLGVLSYQMRTQRKLLLLQWINSMVFTLHYLLIGAISGMALNMVSVTRNGVFFFRNVKGGKGQVIPLIFTGITAVVGIITWEAWYSIFMFSGMVIHAFCMALSSAQTVRKSILLTSPLVIIYDIFAGSIGGIVYETIAIVSAVIGILRYRKKKETDGTPDLIGEEVK